MAQNPELALWRTVLFIALKEPDAVQWLGSDDAATVCNLAGLDVEGVQRSFYRGQVKQSRRKKAA